MKTSTIAKVVNIAKKHAKRFEWRSYPLGEYHSLNEDEKLIWVQIFHECLEHFRNKVVSYADLSPQMKLPLLYPQKKKTMGSSTVVLLQRRLFISRKRNSLNFLECKRYSFNGYLPKGYTIADKYYASSLDKMKQKIIEKHLI